MARSGFEVLKSRLSKVKIHVDQLSPYARARKWAIDPSVVACKREDILLVIDNRLQFVLNQIPVFWSRERCNGPVALN